MWMALLLFVVVVVVVHLGSAAVLVDVVCGVIYVQATHTFYEDQVINAVPPLPTPW